MLYYWRELRYRIAVWLVRLARRLMPAYRQRLYLFHRSGNLYEWPVYANQGDKLIGLITDALRGKREPGLYVEEL